jgi:hypothetical protein
VDCSTNWINGNRNVFGKYREMERKLPIMIEKNVQRGNEGVSVVYSSYEVLCAVRSEIFLVREAVCCYKK